MPCQLAYYAIKLSLKDKGLILLIFIYPLPGRSILDSYCKVSFPSNAYLYLQVAQIVRNLSFEEDNVPVLARNLTCVRFCLLCCR